MTTARDPEIASGKPMSASGIVRMLKIAVERSGVGQISAHDLQRSHITFALDNGAPLQDMQAQAGHANTSTTLCYAQAADAKARRERIALLVAQARHRRQPLWEIIGEKIWLCWTAVASGITGRCADPAQPSRVRHEAALAASQPVGCGARGLPLREAGRYGGADEGRVPGRP